MANRTDGSRKELNVKLVGTAADFVSELHLPSNGSSCWIGGHVAECRECFTIQSSELEREKEKEQ